MKNNAQQPSRRNLLVMIATYNEAKNIKLMFDRLSSQPLEFDILVVDDNSPDGTGQIVAEIMSEKSGIYLISRSEKLGVGSAHLEGIRYAYRHCYQKLLTLDCDFSHDPDLIPEIYEASYNFDVVTTNRFIEDDGLETWAVHRRLLTNISRFLIYIFLRLPFDSTGAFRIYDLKKIPPELFEKTKSRSYSFFWESMYLLWRNDFSVFEKPIKLPARTYGSSKMRLKDISGSLFFLLLFFTQSFFSKERFLVSSAVRETSERENSEDEWDKYWHNKNTKSQRAGTDNFSLYDVIATLYRRYLIRPNLDNHISKIFEPGSSLVHAGCGSGEVDINLVEKMKIKAVDFSSQALEIYRANHPGKAETYKADISSLPFKDEEFDGVYNLGVMEHFSREDILRILIEFHRITKSGGKVILFWPPVYGVSVIGLHIIHAFMRYVLRKKGKLHPEEPSKISTRTAAIKLLTEAGFTPRSWSLSFADFFTYVVLVREKTKNN